MNASFHQAKKPASSLPSDPPNGFEKLKQVSTQLDALDSSVSFVLNVIFDRARSKMDVRIARAMFFPTANIVLIPRERPTLACAMCADEFFAKESEVLSYEGSWRESTRSHDPFADGKGQTRIKAQILLDSDMQGVKPRRVDAIFTLRGLSPAQRISSCTLVFDETYNGHSPATLY